MNENSLRKARGENKRWIRNPRLSRTPIFVFLFLSLALWISASAWGQDPTLSNGNAESDPSLSKITEPAGIGITGETSPVPEATPFADPTPERKIPEASVKIIEKQSVPDFLDPLQDRFVRLMSDRLLLLFRTTKLKIPLLNEALAHLVVEFLVLDRLRHPQREAPLSFEKSVATRIAVFRRLPDESDFQRANPPPNAQNARTEPATIRRYGARFPLNMRKDRDRLAALILLWMEKNDKDIQTLAKEYRQAAQTRWPASENEWETARIAAGRLLEKTLADLAGRKERAVFSLRWGKLDRPIRKAAGTETPLDPLPLLPLPVSPSPSGSERNPSYIGD